MEIIITATARIVDKNSGQPIPGDGTIVKFYDKDVFEDDFLGQSQIDESGFVSISFEPSDFSSIDSPGEKLPDLFFTVYKYGKLLYKSKVFQDFDIDRFANLDVAKGKKIDLGTFAI